MNVLSPMVADRLSNAHAGNNAVFHNQAANFSAYGNITGTQLHRGHGMRHGSIFVPFDIGVMEGKWIALDDERESQYQDAFATLRKAVQDIGDSREQMDEILRMIATAEAR